VYLRITLQEHCVAQTCRLGVRPGPGKHRAGQVKADRVTRRDEPRGRERGAAAAAAHVTAGPQVRGIENHGRERRVHAVIAGLVVDPVGDGLAGVPVLGLLRVRDAHLMLIYRLPAGGSYPRSP
jgi:hypothetical protein